MWPSTQLRETETEDHKYVDGLESLGNKLICKSDVKEKEVGGFNMSMIRRTILYSTRGLMYGVVLLTSPRR